jgi:prepilin-type N-terminal cleavage/methylation domain-containing protein
LLSIDSPRPATGFAFGPPPRALLLCRTIKEPPMETNSRGRERLRAFTLIELLIVVAIIAILAAVAVPNFLEAQIRARTARVRAEMRTVSTAVEAYAVDSNKYPFYNNPEDDDYGHYNRSHPGGLSEGRFERRLPVSITTPIAYLSTLMLDLFSNNHAEEEVEKTPHPYHWSNDQDDSADPNAEPGLDQYPVRGLFTMVDRNTLDAAPYSNDSVVWMILSHGPDQTHDNPDDGAVPVAYDPTNGTLSEGDMYYFGPGIGYR